MKNYSTEYIEQYLEGKLSVNENNAFEAEMAQSENLKQEVDLQRKIVERISVLAFVTAIPQAHSNYVNGSSVSNVAAKGVTTTKKWLLIKFFSTIVIASGIVFGVYKFIQEVPSEIEVTNSLDETVNFSKESITAIDTLEAIKKDTNNNKLILSNGRTELPQSVQYVKHKIYANKKTVINDPRSGAKITIPANALINRRTGEKVTGEVDLNYREFRNVADIALSGIPMDYNGDQFVSAGMFEIRAFDGADTLDIIKGKEVSIDFNMTKNEDGIGFYGLDDKSNKWDLIEKVKKESDVKDPKLERFLPYQQFSNGETKDLTKGTHIITLNSYSCGHCQDMQRDLEELKQAGVYYGGSYVLGYGNEFDQKAFVNGSGTENLPMYTLNDYREFGDLLNGSDFPKLIIVEDGMVKKSWDSDSYSKNDLFTYYGLTLYPSKTQTITKLFNPSQPIVLDSISDLNPENKIEVKEIEDALKYQSLLSAVTIDADELNVGNIKQQRNNNGDDTLSYEYLQDFIVEPAKQRFLIGTGDNMSKSRKQIKQSYLRDGRLIYHNYYKKNEFKITSKDKIILLYDENISETKFSEFSKLQDWNLEVVRTQKQLLKLYKLSGEYVDIHIVQDSLIKDSYNVVLTSKKKKVTTLKANLLNISSLSDYEEQYNQYVRKRENRLLRYEKALKAWEESLKNNSRDTKKNLAQLESQLTTKQAFLDSMKQVDEFFENIKLIMTEEELAMTEEEWESYSTNNSEVKERVDKYLQNANLSEDKFNYYQEMKNSTSNKEIELEYKNKLNVLKNTVDEIIKNELQGDNHNNAKILKSKEEIKMSNSGWKSYVLTSEAKLYYTDWKQRLNKIEKHYKLEYEQIELKFRKTMAEINKDRITINYSSNNAYAKVNRAFKLADFGVYNCDQVKRIKNKISIYAHLSNGNVPINHNYNVYLIDTKAEGAFSFSPSNISCNKERDNAIVLVDIYGNIYLYSYEEWGKANVSSSKHYDFEMEDVTSKVKKPSDLLRMLNN